MGELSDWVHLDAIQALVHHATAVIAAIFLFGVTGRLIAYLIPNGHAKQIVIVIDDIILLAVFALAGWRLLEYMWVRPHMGETPEEAVRITQPDQRGDAAGIQALIAQCRAPSQTGDELAQCLLEKNAAAQREMAAAAARMTAAMRALDKVGSSKIGAARGFDAAQQAFVQYREAECRWRATSATNAASTIVYQACMAELARHRTAQIDEILR